MLCVKVSTIVALVIFPMIALLQPLQAEKPPSHVVLLVIDGLQAQALELIDLPILKAVAAEGVYYRNCETIAPYHPNQGRWLDLHNSAIPNPVMLAGTVLINHNTRYIHHLFQEQRRPTAHATNSNYSSINDGFTYTYLDDTGKGTDEDATYWALEFFRRGKPAYMRIHLQDLGAAARQSLSATGDEKWAGNIWAADSPYRQAARQADALLGQFLKMLREERLLEETVLAITADHGMSRIGRHPYWDPDSARTPLVLRGPGIRRGLVFDYCDSVDIFPTLAHLAGLASPESVEGIVLAEALENPPAHQRQRELTLREINEVLYAYDDLIQRLQPAVLHRLPLRSRVEILDNTFYGVRRFGEWSDFASAREVYEHNKAIYEQVVAIARETGVDPESRERTQPHPGEPPE
jgi:hypothetical protein